MSEKVEIKREITNMTCDYSGVVIDYQKAKEAIKALYNALEDTQSGNVSKAGFANSARIVVQAYGNPIDDPEKKGKGLPDNTVIKLVVTRKTTNGTNVTEIETTSAYTLKAYRDMLSLAEYLEKNQPTDKYLVGKAGEKGRKAGKVELNPSDF